jgi:DNA-binding NtrC family response regulator
VRDDPQAPDRHILLLYDVTEIHQLRQTIDESRYGRMLGNCEPMRELYRLIDDVARGDWTVLIEGETGVGKELVAHSIHAASPRKDGPFIAVNSAGLSESLLASQLFGHRKGAFTGAVSDQEGFFEAAHGGTLFLDEIGDLPLSMQASLLRVLQEKEITRLGETRMRKVDVRILAATHKDLANEVNEGRFREDLLYRLRVARLYVPALRERKADIPLLVEAFLCQSYHFSSRAQPRFGAEALQCLMNYDWPGNVRELKACVDYAVIHSKGECVNPQDLPPEFCQGAASAVVEPEPMAAEGDERGRILAALKKSRGNRQQAAKLLGISRATFYRRLTELDISPNQ